MNEAEELTLWCAGLRWPLFAWAASNLDYCREYARDPIDYLPWWR